MGRVASVLLVLLVTSLPAFAAQPVCVDGPCAPSTTSSTYPSTLSARPKLTNARGRSSSIAPRITPSTPTGGGAAGVTVLAGSESYSYAVPILSLPGRNGLDLNLTLYYSSRVWTIDAGTASFNGDRDFPSYGFRLGFGFLEYDSTNGAYILTESDGTKRRLPLTSGSSYDSDDTSFINYNSGSKVLKYKNGTQVLYAGFPSASTKLFRPTQITDTNGNFISIAYVSGKDQEISTIIDTLGRVITFNYNGSSQLSTITQGGQTYATFTWGTTTLNYTFSGLTVQDTLASGSSINVLTDCTYANSTSYHFAYGDWGIANTITRKSSSGTLRSSVSYNYPTAATALSSHPTWTTETFNDGENTLYTTYSSTKVSGVVSTYTVTDPGGTKTVATLNTSGTYQGLMSSLEIQDGSTPVRHIDNTWTSDTGGKNPRPATVTTTLSDSGQQSKVAYTYTTYGNPSLVQEYDYGLVLKRQTAMTYLTTSTYTTTYHIQDRVTQVLVKDGAGAIVGRTDLAYDGSGLTSVTGASHHNDASYSSSFLTRGNVTQIKRYSNAAAGSGLVTRNFAYDSLGNLRTADLDCCSQKTWSYSSTTQYAYPDSATRGSGPTLSTSATYNFSAGVGSGTVATATDENGKVTQFTYDNMDRPATATLPSSVQATASYNDSAVSAAVSRSNSVNSAIQLTAVDGRGRTQQQQLLNGSTSVSLVTTAYNDVLLQISTSNPKGPSESSVWTTTQFDNLGRTTSVSPPSGGSYGYAYSGNAVTITDPAGKQRRNTTDALGRLVKVEEPGWGDGIGGKGSVTISGTEQSTRGQICDNGDPPQCHMGVTGYDSGSVSITVNGATKTVGYQQGSTSSTVAADMANTITADSNYPAYASASGSTVNLTAKVANSSSNYSLTASSLTDDPGTYGGPSFTGTPSGPTLTGATDGSGPDNPTLVTPITSAYTYDALDNLTSVSQEQGWPLNGQPLPAQTRTYVYDSLSRLTSAATPESGTVLTYYTTSGGGNCAADASAVCRRIDARGITSTYSYDGLNRLTGVTYSDGTPSTTYTYGTSTASNNNGRLVSLADGGGSESYTYDLMGRITQASKVISGGTYNVGYGYNSAGQLNSLTYPSGRVVSQSYDAIGWMSAIASSGTNYLSSPSYNAAGQTLGFSYGNGVQATFSYNDHLQLASLRYSKPGNWDMMNQNYDYGAGNNGQIQAIHLYNSPGVENSYSPQSYTYDAWGRLKTSSTAGLEQNGAWRMEWDYDRFGNRRNQTLTGGNVSVTQPQLTISETTNRITDAGYAYDSAGNMTNDSLHTYAYDAENRTKTIDSTGATYTYSGALRVRKVVGATTTVYVFSGSKLIAEYANGALSQEYVYAGWQLLTSIAADGTATYHHPDHLSIRSDSNADGNQIRSYGHFPFGEIWGEEAPQGQTLVPSKWKFTSYERDAESGVDYAIFRNYSSRLGRFMQADPLAGSISDPQSLNRYAYTRNDPVNLVDPLGLFLSRDPRGLVLPLADSGWCEVYVPNGQGYDGYLCGGGGGGGDFGNVSQTGKKQQQILDALKRLRDKLMNDPDCLAFLGGEKGVTAFLNQYGNFIGHADFLTSTANAKSNIGMVNGQLFETLINNTGQFYQDKNGPVNPGMSFSIRGGGPAAQEFILLHEIAHGFDASTGFVPDAGDDDAQKFNNSLLDSNCAKTLGKK